MRSLGFVYGGIGVLVGLFLSYLFAGTFNANDLLVGALFGLLIGFLLAMARLRIWDRR